jgi:hypothetical protein
MRESWRQIVGCGLVQLILRMILCMYLCIYVSMFGIRELENIREVEIMPNVRDIEA